MTQNSTNFSRYLPPDQQARKWGWRLVDAGRQRVNPGADYPATDHPNNYLFDKNGSRTLDEYQIIYIAAGSGSFESESTPKTDVFAGTAMLLFPGEWHRYAPASESGWTEYWLGFHGREANRIMEAFYSPGHALHTVGQPDVLIHHLHQILHWLDQPVTAKEQILASHIPLALALLHSKPLNDATIQGSDIELTARAKTEILKSLETRTDLEALAQKLGVSYSRFRFAFKKQTGYSPREFENMGKLNRACDLLLHEQKSVSETAHSLDYSSVYYFSRAFKKQFQKSPQQWLKSRLNT
jgi:AraC-like DNA-binding protein